jgi:hypothetical protein
MDTRAVWKEYEKQMASPKPGQESWSGVVKKINSGYTVPTYVAKFLPFCAGANEILAFTTAMVNLKASGTEVEAALADLVKFLNSVKTSGLFPNIKITIPTLDIAGMIGVFVASYNLLDASQGICGLTLNFPTNLIAALQNTVNMIKVAAIGKMINFMNEVDTMFSAPTRMINDIMNWTNNTKNSVKGPFAEERDNINLKLRELRREIKVTDNPLIKEQINTQMNGLGKVDRLCRDLTTKTRTLEDAVNKFLLNLEICSKLGSALARNIPNIIAQWEKDAVCVAKFFKLLINRV